MPFESFASHEANQSQLKEIIGAAEDLLEMLGAPDDESSIQQKAWFAVKDTQFRGETYPECLPHIIISMSSEPKVTEWLYRLEYKMGELLLDAAVYIRSYTGPLFAEVYETNQSDENTQFLPAFRPLTSLEAVCIRADLEAAYSASRL